jgi:hypothetical protein
MRRGRIIAVATAAVAAMAFAAPGGLAATPREISNDLADGRLNGKYTKQELASYLQSATAQGYESPVGAVAGAAVTRSSSTERQASGGTQGGTLAFTGIDLALLTVGGLLLLALGALLRWGTRERGWRRN